MPYAIVGPGIQGVYAHWKDIEFFTKIFPYCSYRKFADDISAWNFVNQNKRKYSDLTMTKYGNTFDNVYLQLDYLFQNNMFYFTYNTKHIGNIRFDERDDALIEYRVNSIFVETPAPSGLNSNSIFSHLAAIQAGVEFAGELVDIDVLVPDHSIYYALTVYNGQNAFIRSVQEILRNRIAEISFTLKG